MKVLVLGSGPAGLLAAHAAAEEGHDVLIYSKRQKSPLYGCQYLHSPVPVAAEGRFPKAEVSYELAGEVNNYRARVYDPALSGINTSPESLLGNHFAWDIRATYDYLWDVFGDYVQEWDLDFKPINVLMDYLRPDLTFSTVPAPLLCRVGHQFKTAEVWAMGDAPDLGQEAPLSEGFGDNRVVCNGLPFGDGPSWYRMSRVFGYGTVEWPIGLKKPPYPGVARVKKPISTNCSCHEVYGIIRLGRYGKWQKGVLSDSAYHHVKGHLALGAQGTLW